MICLLGHEIVKTIAMRSIHNAHAKGKQNKSVLNTEHQTLSIGHTETVGSDNFVCVALDLLNRLNNPKSSLELHIFICRIYLHTKPNVYRLNDIKR